MDVIPEVIETADFPDVVGVLFKELVEDFPRLLFLVGIMILISDS